MTTAILGKKFNWIVLTIILFTTFIPSFGNYAIYKLIIIFALWCIKSTQQIVDENIISYRKKGRNIILFWFLSIFLAAITVVIVEGGLNQSTIIHEISRIAYYLFLIDLCFKTTISLTFLFYACSVIILVHCIIQWAQTASYGPIENYITEYYINGEENLNHYLGNKTNAIHQDKMMRAGSIFVNPNVYVCYPYISLGVFLQYYRRKKGYLPLIMIGVAFMSIVYTGSRMGMGSFLFILAWYLWYSSRVKSNKSSIKGYSVIFLLLLFVVLYGENLGEWFGETRAFSLDTAYDTSGEIKFLGFLGYLKLSYPLEWLFGSLGADRLAIPIDAEWGYIFAWFGIFGLIWYLKLIKLVYDYHKTTYPIISTVAAFAIILTAIGASSVLNMSVFPYICAISFTNLLSSQK